MTEHSDNHGNPAAHGRLIRAAATLAVAAALGMGAVNLGIGTSPGTGGARSSNTAGGTELAGRLLNHNEILIRPGRRR